MTYLIDIAHPNALDDRRVVDEVHNFADILDCLLHPSFSWNPYDVVRVTQDYYIAYTGFFTNTECVDIGYQSNMWNRLDGVFAPNKAQSVVEFWQDTKDPYKLLYRLECILDRNLMTKIVIHCAQFAAKQCPYQRRTLVRCIDSIKYEFENRKHANKIADLIESVRVLGTQDEVEPLGTQDAAQAIRIIANTKGMRHSKLSDAIEYSSVSVMKSQGIPQKAAEARVMNEVKSILTFYDVLKGLANK